MAPQSSRRTRRPAALASAVALLVAVLGVGDADASERVQVFATIPDLADLAARVGGDEVEAFSMVQGREDPHFAQPRPSLIKRLSQADIYLTIGMDAEIGYEEALLRNANNPKVMPGRSGYVVAGTVVEPLGVVSGTVVTRAMGDIHARGNPHYNLDPLAGLRVADLIRARLSTIRPDKAEYFDGRYQALRRMVGERLVGAELDAKYDGTKLAMLFQHGKLEEFLAQQGDADKLSGWLATMAPYRGAEAVDDHPMWPYFARAFGLVIVGDLEPKPGLPPTTSHLKQLIETMKAQDVPLLIQSPYYDPRHARLVSDATGATVVLLAHQVGAVPGADDWLSMFDYNVRTIADALAARKRNEGAGGP